MAEPPDKPDKVIRVTKVTTTDGTFYTKQEYEPGYYAAKEGVTSALDMEMLQKDYDALPVSDMAKTFFQGKRIGSRPN